MTMKRYLLLISSMILLFGCSVNKSKHKAEYYMFEVSDKALEGEMAKFISVIKKRDNIHYGKCDSVRFAIDYCRINDSIECYVVSPFVDPEILRSNPFHVMCKVKNDTCFFRIAKRSLSRSAICLSDSSYRRMASRYFPLTYSNYISKHESVVQYFPTILYEPELCCITVRNGAIIETHTYRGLPEDSFWDKE